MPTVIQDSFFGVDIPEDEWGFFLDRTGSARLCKGDYFFQPDKVCDKLGLIQRGLMRSFVTIDEKEYNIEFYSERQFVSAFTSFLTEKTSDWHIQALEDSEVIVVSRALLYRLYERHSCWVEFGKKIFELQTVKKCKREKSLIRDNAMSRYKMFLEEYHGIENRLPLFQIASYLGIEPETLSRVRKKYVQELRRK